MELATKTPGDTDKKLAGKKQKLHHHDHITDKIGRFGPWQILLYLVTGPTISLHAWMMLENKFLTYPSVHWCARPSMLANLNVTEWLEISAPKLEDGSFDRCHYFDVDYNSTITRPDESTSVIACSKWEYEETPFNNTIIKRWNLVCGNMTIFPTIVKMVFFVGNMFGVLLIGPFADWFGRKVGYMTCLTIWSITGTIGYFADNPFAWITTRFICGAASLALQTAISVYRVEITSGSYRAKTNSWHGGFGWELGHISLGLLVYLIPDMLHLELFVALSAIPWMVLWYFMPESPRWLLTKGRVEEAKQVMATACKMNNQPLSNLDDVVATLSKEKKGNISDLFKYPATRRNAISMNMCWLAFSMGYFGLIYNTPAFNWNIYLVFIFPGLVILPLIGVMPYLENKLGRKFILTSTLTTAGVLLLLTLAIPKDVFPSNWPIIVLAWAGTVFCSLAFGSGYLFTKEIFPTELRATALGMASAAARVGSMLSPAIALLDVVHPVMPLATYGCVVLFAGIHSIWLWPETKKTVLPDGLEDAEAIASTPNEWFTYFRRLCQRK